MAKINYKDLYTLTIDEIEKRIKYNSGSSYDSQLSRTNVSPVSFGTGNSSVESSDLINSIMNLLEDALPQQIIEGLEVSAENPISSNVLVKAGKGSVGGRLYELEEDVTLTIPFDDTNKMFYVVLYNGGIMIEKSVLSTQLAVAKIVVPVARTDQYVQDTRGITDFDKWNAYIINFKEYKLYGYQDRFEEDTLDLLRNNIGPILADNLIGNIRLSENLKISNTQGTLQLDSNQMLLKDFDQNTLAKFNDKGIYFYDSTGAELAKFSSSGARIGNIQVGPHSLYSSNYVPGVSGFEIKDTGETEFQGLVLRGNIYATGGTIGGWGITDSMIFANTTGTIQTGETVGAGSNGVILDINGIRVYDDILGIVVNLPSDGSAPTFSSGIINSTIFNINTNAIIRTSETVGDGTINSSGLLINDSGLYACGQNQLLNEANIKILSSGNAFFKGEIQASSGIIGNVTIQNNMLSGGTITGTMLVAPIIETATIVPKIRIDNEGIYYQISASVGKYAEFKYGDGTFYGTGVSAFLFNINYPILAITSETDMADIRLYNRSTVPTTGKHEVGDLICVEGVLKICTSAGQPGTFTTAGSQT